MTKKKERTQLFEDIKSIYKMYYAEACKLHCGECPYDRIEERELISSYTTLMHGCCVAEIGYATKRALQLYE